MNSNISTTLTEGLLKGYAGDGEISDVSRAGFSGKMSHQVLGPDGVYHDEWFVPTHLGGGQELVKSGTETYTRVYAGGAPSAEKLSELGITADEVGAYLKQKITELGEQTRLHEECRPEAEGNWRYEYKILLREETIGVTVGVESIFYKNVRVHIHPFVLSPVQ